MTAPYVRSLPLAPGINQRNSPTLGVEERDGRLVRVRPRRIGGPAVAGNEPPAATTLSEITGVGEDHREALIRAQLLAGSR